MHMCSYIALVAQVSPCMSFHIIHACALVFGCLSGLSSPVFLLLPSVPLPALPANLVPDEISMEDPLCNSSFGSMVTLDYVTPVTESDTLDCRNPTSLQDHRDVHSREGTATAALPRSTAKSEPCACRTTTGMENDLHNRSIDHQTTYCN